MTSEAREPGGVARRGASRRKPVVGPKREGRGTDDEQRCSTGAGASSWSLDARVASNEDSIIP